MPASPKKPQRPDRGRSDAADRKQERDAAKEAYQGSGASAGVLPDEVKQRIRERVQRERDAARSHYQGKASKPH